MKDGENDDGSCFSCENILFIPRHEVQMFALTRQEQLIIASIITALLVGAAVKHWRESRPPLPPAMSHPLGPGK